MRWFVIVLIPLLLFTACESYPPAPTIERTPNASKPAPPVKSVAKPNTVRDWQPDSYIVKKGDTLFSIALQFGYYYKEIAAANNISEPYPIKIGQKLSFTSLNTKAISADSKPVLVESDDGVIVSPIKTDPAATPSATNMPTVSNVTPLLTEPKAIREPYSLEALNRKTIVAKPSETTPADAKPTDTKQTDIKPTDDESIVWTWPTQGRTIASFDGATNKGIDIAGIQGQSISAASNGKVIYVGSDLRGYGKLVIIKHNKTFLSVYAHNSKIIAKEGQLVTAGQKIAEMGNTDSNTIKLHFEIRQQGKSVDPAKFLPQN